jgi:hypothetical protein
MPKREDDIRASIERLEGAAFERFARELLGRDIYPGLNPTSRTHDLGEDARTEPSTYFQQGEQRISLAISKEDNWSKLKADCDRCVATRRRIDVLAFVTAGHPRTDVVEQWREEVKKAYGWNLEVRSIEYLSPLASRPQYESLVDDYLSVPPPGEDYIQEIEEKFTLQTSRYLDNINLHIPGMSGALPREEVTTIGEQISQGRQIVLTGEAGTGKSGIAAILARNALTQGKVVLFLDSRRIGHVTNDGELRGVFDLRGPLYKAINRIAKHKGCRIIIDQLDNIAGMESARLITDLVVDCLREPGELEIIIVCRNKEPHESELLSKILSHGFIELTCHELSQGEVKHVLEEIGIPSSQMELVELGRNFLNLELIGQIHSQRPDFDFSALKDEVYLWEAYITSWRSREDGAAGEEMLGRAMSLARQALNDPDGLFVIDIPAPRAVDRLVSWGVISLTEGRRYRFRHEKFQDFIYAWDAADRGLKPGGILGEILDYRSRNVFKWVSAIYAHRNSPLRSEFLKEAFNV